MASFLSLKHLNQESESSYRLGGGSTNAFTDSHHVYGCSKAWTLSDIVIFQFPLNQAQHNDLQVDYDHMKKSFDRLKEEHSKLANEYKDNYAQLKQKDEKIILALQSKWYIWSMGI